MLHDALCELRQTQFTPHGIRTPSCQCGSRAFPLCEPCQQGQHIRHSDGKCRCDLCVSEDVA